MAKLCTRANNYRSTHQIPEKNKTYQTEDATRNVFTNIIFRVIITGLLTIIDHAKMKKNFKADIHIYNGIIN